MFKAQWVIGLMVLAGVSCVALGTQLSFEMATEFSGATPPAGATPWMTATFDDSNSAGSVTLTMENTNLVDSENVFEWYFNLDPMMDPNGLTFSDPNKSGTFDDPSISTEIDAFPADGDGSFDILFTFGNGNASKVFGAGESVEYTITGTSLTASSFDYLSAPTGGSVGPFETAAHVRGVNDAYSGWVTTVPEPASVLLMGLGFPMLFRRMRRK